MPNFRLLQKILKTVSAAGVGIYLIQIPIINYISVKYDQALYAWLKDDAFIRGLFVFIVAAIMVVALQGLWRALKDALRLAPRVYSVFE